MHKGTVLCFVACANSLLTSARFANCKTFSIPADKSSISEKSIMDSKMVRHYETVKGDATRLSQGSLS